MRKDLKDKNLINEETPNHTFQQKIYREKVKLNRASKKINYDQLKELIEQNSVCPGDVKEPYIVYSNVNDSSEELRYMMIIR